MITMSLNKKIESLNFIPSTPHHSDELWRENKSSLFSYRLNLLKIGDALLSESSSWAIYYVVENGKSVYNVYCDGDKVLSRRKSESIVPFLIKNNAPDDLDFAESGAMSLYNFLDYNHNFDSLDYSNYYDIKEYYSNHPVGIFTHMQKLLFDISKIFVQVFQRNAT